MYNPKHQRIGNPLKFYSAKSAEPIGERALSKLKVRGTAPLYAATKPKARSPMGFLLSALPVLRTLASTPVVVARKESVHGMQP